MKKLTSKNVKAVLFEALCENSEEVNAFRAAGMITDVIIKPAKFPIRVDVLEKHREQIEAWLAEAGPYVPEEIKPNPFYAPLGAFRFIRKVKPSPEMTGTTWTEKTGEAACLVAMGMALSRSRAAISLV